MVLSAAISILMVVAWAYSFSRAARNSARQRWACISTREMTMEVMCYRTSRMYGSPGYSKSNALPEKDLLETG